ncbi:MAG: mannose-6-phosphate isomerase, class I [Deltaproteobacteria bacterium]|nr:mannose-6-phosphate isomerase, class I [Deltaproteobacteria bacterium]
MLDTISLLRNPIQHYAWGSKTAIPKLLNIPNPERNPMAELWMGAHPKAPSQVCVDGRWISLIDVIASSPESVLGSEVARRFDSQLPFLFKILAAAEPLSIQVHPNKQQAIEGFTKENELGISLDAPYRNYRDDNHKPELLCALTPFEALKGFRPVGEALALMETIAVPELSPLVDGLRNHPDMDGLKRFFRILMKMGKSEQARMVSRVVERAKEKARERRELYWVMELGKKYPGDVGVLSPLFLNLIYLEPGQAMFLPAGELHAYLGGTGLEIMANSDNVLRGLNQGVRRSCTLKW